MSLHPREPLTAEERALAAQLPRLHGSVEPGAKLDARILAAAHGAVSAPPANRPRLRWIAPMAVAASLSLAVGLAWRLQPPATVTIQAPMADAVVTDPPHAKFVNPAAEPAQERQAVPAPPPGSPGQMRPASPRAVAAIPAIPPDAAPAPPPPAPPAPPAATVADLAVARDNPVAPAVAQSSSQGMAKAARTGEAARDSGAAATAPRQQANEATRAESAAADEPQPFSSDDPGEEVPPASADSPDVRDAWLRRIGELLQQGRREEAKASLAEFRRRYPDAPLPPDLRALEP